MRETRKKENAARAWRKKSKDGQGEGGSVRDSQRDNRTRSCGEDLPSPRSFHLPLIFVPEVSARFENGRCL